MSEEKKEKKGKPKSRGNGDGSIYYSEARKSWAAQITVGKNEKGNPKRRTVYGKTRKEVKAKMEKIQNEVKFGTYAEPSQLILSDWIESLVKDDYSMNYLTPGSYARKMNTVSQIKSSDIASMPIQKITEANITAFLCSITHYSDSVIGKIYGLLRRSFEEAVKRNIISVNVFINVRKPKSQKITEEVRALTLAEQKKLLEVFRSEDVEYKPQMLLSMYTGMRMGEINALDINDVNLNFKTITVRRTITRDDKDHSIIGKTTKTYAGKRKIPINEATKKLLKNCIDNWQPNEKNLLFFDYRKNNVITTSQVNLVLSRILEKHSILDTSENGKVSLHSLRHTYATRSIEGGMPAKVLASLLGHKDIKVTLNTYCNAFAEYQDKQVATVESYMIDNELVC